MKIKSEELLEEGARGLKIYLSEEQIRLFIIYLKEIKEGNRRLNLTAIREEEGIIVKHFLDALTCTLVLDLRPDLRLIDVGTGAGLPGIPLKIYQPQIRLTLLDSSKKKIDFLKHVCFLLFPNGVNILWGRAETYGRDVNYRETFDLAISRAVADLRTLSEYCLPFIKVGGFFLAQKGPRGEKELEAASVAISTLGGKFREVREVSLPFLGERRQLIVIDKVSGTPDKYPRRIGMPEKRPL